MRAHSNIEYNHRLQVNSLIIREDPWEVVIKEVYKKDELAKLLLKKPSANENVRIENGFIFIKDAIYILSQLRREIFQQYYKIRMAGH